MNTGVISDTALVQGCRSMSQHALGESWGTPWTGHIIILTDKNIHTFRASTELHTERPLAAELESRTGDSLNNKSPCCLLKMRCK